VFVHRGVVPAGRWQKGLGLALLAGTQTEPGAAVVEMRFFVKLKGGNHSNNCQLFSLGLLTAC